MIKRRQAIKLIGGAAAAWPFSASAQAPSRRRLIGFIDTGSKEPNERYHSGFRQGMRELGHRQDDDYLFEGRYADGDPARLAALAQDLVQLKPALIVASTTTAALAAKAATGNIPIVCPSMQDPVGVGLVASEARPATNVTGILTRVEGLAGKQLEIARDLKPEVGKIGILINSGGPGGMVQLRETEVAAATLKTKLIPIDVRAAVDVGPAFRAFASENAAFIIISGNPLFLTMRRQIAAVALASHLPTIFRFREHVEDGGLISYGINLREAFRRAAYYVDRILKGEKPDDLPIEFPTKLELVINLATAKALGLAIPPTLLARADEVIE